MSDAAIRPYPAELDIGRLQECWEMAGRELDEFLGSDINYLRYIECVKRNKEYRLNEVVITS